VPSSKDSPDMCQEGLIKLREHALVIVGVPTENGTRPLQYYHEVVQMFEVRRYRPEGRDFDSQ
jgi:hypothetical protein